MKILLCALLAAFTFTAGNASAAPKPNMHLTWTKVQRVWTAAARKHGAKVECPIVTSPWTGGKIVCTFTAGAKSWTGDFQFAPGSCGVSMTFVSLTSRRMLGIQNLSACEKRWWVAVATPWTYPDKPLQMVG